MNGGASPQQPFWDGCGYPQVPIIHGQSHEGIEKRTRTLGIGAFQISRKHLGLPRKFKKLLRSISREPDAQTCMLTIATNIACHDIIILDMNTAFFAELTVWRFIGTPR